MRWRRRLCCDATRKQSLELPNEQLEEFFILSELKIEPAEEPSAPAISKTTARQMRAVLAASSDRGNERGASGIVRSL